MSDDAMRRCPVCGEPPVDGQALADGTSDLVRWGNQKRFDHEGFAQAHPDINHDHDFPAEMLEPTDDYRPCDPATVEGVSGALLASGFVVRKGDVVGEVSLERNGRIDLRLYGLTEDGDEDDVRYMRGTDGKGNYTHEEAKAATPRASV